MDFAFHLLDSYAAEAPTDRPLEFGGADMASPFPTLDSVGWIDTSVYLSPGDLRFLSAAAMMQPSDGTLEETTTHVAGERFGTPVPAPGPLSDVEEAALLEFFGGNRAGHRPGPLPIVATAAAAAAAPVVTTPTTEHHEKSALTPAAAATPAPVPAPAEVHDTAAAAAAPTTKTERADAKKLRIGLSLWDAIVQIVSMLPTDDQQAAIGLIAAGIPAAGPKGGGGRNKAKSSKNSFRVSPSHIKALVAELQETCSADTDADADSDADAHADADCETDGEE